MGDRPERVRGYVLAGGQSLRMGQSKAAIVLGGRSLLGTALATMRAATEEVAIVGGAESLPGDVRRLEDGVRGCGPMGGMEVALRDAGRHGASWAAFLPVDVPLLPSGLFHALVGSWTASETAWVGMVVARSDAGGEPARALGRAQLQPQPIMRLQPLVSVVHVEVLPHLQAALSRSDYKLQPVLRAAAQQRAEESKIDLDLAFTETQIDAGDELVSSPGKPRSNEVHARAFLGWRPTAQEWSWRSLWFANVNTPAELKAIQAVMEREPAEEDRVEEDLSEPVPSRIRQSNRET